MSISFRASIINMDNKGVAIVSYHLHFISIYSCRIETKTDITKVTALLMTLITDKLGFITVITFK